MTEKLQPATQVTSSDQISMTEHTIYKEETDGMSRV